MGFWILQISVDLLFLGTLLVMYRKNQQLKMRLLLSEMDIRSIQKGLQATAAPTLPDLKTPISVSAVDIPLQPKKTTLFENQNIERDRANLEVYERADILLAKGLKLSDVSQQTGLSVSELRLIQKMGTRHH